VGAQAQTAQAGRIQPVAAADDVHSRQPGSIAGINSAVIVPGMNGG